MSKADHLTPGKRLAREKGGVVQASDVETLFGWPRRRAILFLCRAWRRGKFERQESGATPLKPGKWEPTYRLI